MARKKPNAITQEQIVQMAKEWDEKSQSEFAREFGVSINLIGSTARALNKQSDGLYCRPRMSRKETIIAALKILKSEKEEVKEHVIS